MYIESCVLFILLQLGTLVPIATPAPPTTVAPSMRFDLQSKNLLNSPPPLLNTPTVSAKLEMMIFPLIFPLIVIHLPPARSAG